MIEQGSIVERRDPQIRRAPNSSGLYDVVDLILDKGLVIDAFVRVSLVGIELLTVDLRVVVASVDTYLRYAEGVERLQLYNRSGAARLPDLVGKTQKGKAIGRNVDKVTDALTGNRHGEDDADNEDSESGEKEPGLMETVGHGVRRIVGSITGGDDDEAEEGGDERGNGHGRGDGAHRRKDHHNGHGRRAKAGAKR